MVEDVETSTGVEPFQAGSYRQRLVVYVVWHPDFAPGAELARRLYDQLTRDSQQPIARGLGIPVYFRSAPAGSGSEAPSPITLEEAHHTAVVVLVDDAMVLSGDLGWSDYLTDIHRQIGASGGHLMLPVMFSGRAFAVAPGVDASNFIRPRSGEPSAWAETLISGRSAHYPLFNAITHELCRLLLEVRRLEHDDAEGYGGQLERRVKVFISHAKKDGRAIAVGIRDYVNQNLQLKTFFDANDIPYGSEFARVLEASVDREHTAVLVVQTDEYSTREWCQREVLWAKKFERPVLILHAVKTGEKCSFPYLGNAPTIRIAPDAAPDMEMVLGQLLVEVLRNIHFVQHCEDLVQLSRREATIKALPQTPELLTLLELKADPKNRDLRTIVYQEPPLGAHLLEILARFAPDLVLTTPILLLTSGLREADQLPPLEGRTIGLSLGNSPDLDRLGFQPAHLEDAMVEFARYLLQAGANLAYGGDLRPGGFTEVLRDLVWTYDASESKTPRLTGYLHWAIHQDRLAQTKPFLDWMDPRGMNRTKFEFVTRPADQAGANPAAPDDRTPENLLIHARCLTAMRERMDAAIGARVLLGGKLTGFNGRYPGLAEEAWRAFRSGKPFYLLGGFGGCAYALIEATLGRKPAALTREFQDRDLAYREMAARHDQIPGVEPIDYPALVDAFEQTGLAGLSRINGLNERENLRLFATPHVIEMVHLVLKGLLNVFGRASA